LRYLHTRLFVYTHDCVYRKAKIGSRMHQLFTAEHPRKRYNHAAHQPRLHHCVCRSWKIHRRLSYSLFIIVRWLVFVAVSIATSAEHSNAIVVSAKSRRSADVAEILNVTDDWATLGLFMWSCKWVCYASLAASSRRTHLTRVLYRLRAAHTEAYLYVHGDPFDPRSISAQSTSSSSPVGIRRRSGEWSDLELEREREKLSEWEIRSKSVRLHGEQITLLRASVANVRNVRQCEPQRYRLVACVIKSYASTIRLYIYIYSTITRTAPGGRTAYFIKYCACADVCKQHALCCT